MPPRNKQRAPDRRPLPAKNNHAGAENPLRPACPPSGAGQHPALDPETLGGRDATTEPRLNRRNTTLPTQRNTTPRIRGRNATNATYATLHNRYSNYTQRNQYTPPGRRALCYTFERTFNRLKPPGFSVPDHTRVGHATFVSNPEIATCNSATTGGKQRPGGQPWKTAEFCRFGGEPTEAGPKRNRAVPGEGRRGSYTDLF